MLYESHIKYLNALATPITPALDQSSTLRSTSTASQLALSRHLDFQYTYIDQVSFIISYALRSFHLALSIQSIFLDNDSTCHTSLSRLDPGHQLHGQEARQSGAVEIRSQQRSAKALPHSQTPLQASQRLNALLETPDADNAADLDFVKDRLVAEFNYSVEIYQIEGDLLKPALSALLKRRLLSNDTVVESGDQVLSIILYNGHG